jgi:hypothetical protein
MNLIEIKNKIINRIWFKIVRYSRPYNWYPYIYKSFWKMKLSNEVKKSNTKQYFTAIPNKGAGIGHQLANWIAGYWFTKQFNLNFTHSPFSSLEWESFLGFGENESSLQELLKNQNYKKVKLPLFNETNEKEIFVCEQDQVYKDQYGVIEEIKRKFQNANSRKVESLIFKKDYFNIAIHVRRGDIVIGQENGNENLQMRWQSNDYFTKLLSQVVQNVKTRKPIAIHLFSQGEKKEFSEFDKFKNMHYCLGMSAQDSFLHMVNADLLITSKSSFSYKPALLSDGIKVCPENFWHSYPSTNNFVLVNDEGKFDVKALNNLSYE